MDNIHTTLQTMEELVEHIDHHIGTMLFYIINCLIHN